MSPLETSRSSLLDAAVLTECPLRDYAARYNHHPSSDSTAPVVVEVVTLQQPQAATVAPLLGGSSTTVGQKKGMMEPFYRKHLDDVSSRLKRDISTASSSSRTSPHLLPPIIPRPKHPPTVSLLKVEPTAVESTKRLQGTAERSSANSAGGPKQQHHFLQGLQLSDVQYNVMDIPSPPSPSSIKPRRRRYSSATTTSRPLRDLTSDKSFENTLDRKNNLLFVDDDEKNIRLSHKSKRNRKSLSHVESPVLERSETTASPVEKESPSSTNRSVRTPIGTTTNQTTVQSYSSTSTIAPDEAANDIQSTTTMRSRKIIGSAQQGISLQNHSRPGCIQSVSDKNPNDKPSLTASALNVAYSNNQRVEGGCVAESSTVCQVLLDFEFTNPIKSSKRRQSTIGIPEKNSPYFSQSKKKRQSLLSPEEVAENSMVSDHVIIPSSVQPESTTIPDTISRQETRQHQPSPRKFPKLPQSDAKQIAPVLSEVRKLIHLYTNNFYKNGGRESKEATGKQYQVLQRINFLTGYVVTPPLTTEQVRQQAEKDFPDLAQSRLELWHRMGPALKQTEKFKNETAAAVEEVTQTRIERHGATYRYYNVRDKKGKKPMNPADYETRYAAMLEEVSNIRSKCWYDYFCHLQAYSKENTTSKNNSSRSSDVDNKQHTNDNHDVVKKQQAKSDVGKNSAVEPTVKIPDTNQLPCSSSINSEYNGTEVENDAVCLLPHSSKVPEVSEDNTSHSLLAHNSTQSNGGCYPSRETIESSGERGDKVDVIKRHVVNVLDPLPSEELLPYNKESDNTPLPRSPLSLDADAYRVAGSLQGGKEMKFVTQGDAKIVLQDDTSGNDEEAVTNGTNESISKREAKSAASSEYSSEEIEELLVQLPSRDEPSLDPDIAKAEKRLWDDLDTALDRYSRTVVSITKRRAAEKIVKKYKTT